MPQIPQLPSVPRVADAQLQKYLADMHDVVSRLHQSSLAPNPPSNLTVTPIAGGCVVQFTRSNGVTFNLYASSSADRALASLIPLGTANRYTDAVGQAAIDRFYWVEALNQGGLPSSIIGPRSATTLGLNAPAATIPDVRQSQVTVFDTTLNRTRPVIVTTDPDVAGSIQPEDI